MEPDHLKEAPAGPLPAAVWPMAESVPRLAQGWDLRWDEGEQVHMLAHDGDLVPLNASAAEILRRCDGELTVRHMINELEAAFETEGLAADVCSFLAESRQRGWLA